MKKIITIILIFSFTISKGQDMYAEKMTHYLIDGSSDVTYNDLSFLTYIIDENHITLSIIDIDVSNKDWILTDYPLELIETGDKGGSFFKKYLVDNNSQNFVSESKRKGTRCYYFFYDRKGGKIKSIVELINFGSSSNIITKRYYP